MRILINPHEWKNGFTKLHVRTFFAFCSTNISNLITSTALTRSVRLCYLRKCLAYISLYYASGKDYVPSTLILGAKLKRIPKLISLEIFGTFSISLLDTGNIFCIHTKCMQNLNKLTFFLLSIPENDPKMGGRGWRSNACLQNDSSQLWPRKLLRMKVFTRKWSSEGEITGYVYLQPTFCLCLSV